MKDALGHGSNARAASALSSGVKSAAAPVHGAMAGSSLRPGDEFTQGKDRYRVTATDWPTKADLVHDGDDFVLARRFIRTTQKFSGNAYVVRLEK